MGIELKTIDIWMEGFAVTGQRGTAQKLASMPGNAFDEAVANLLLTVPEHKKSYRKDDKGNHFIWGCQLFDNETDARKAFG